MRVTLSRVDYKCYFAAGKVNIISKKVGTSTYLRATIFSLFDFFFSFFIVLFDIKALGRLLLLLFLNLRRNVFVLIRYILIRANSFSNKYEKRMKSRMRFSRIPAKGPRRWKNGHLIYWTKNFIRYTSLDSAKTFETAPVAGLCIRYTNFSAFNYENFST